MNTPKHPCRRARVSERRRSAGEPVSQRELAFLSQHVASCRRCRADSAVIRGIADERCEDADEAQESRNIAAAVLTQLSEVETLNWWGRHRPPTPILLAMAATLAVISIGAAAWVFTRPAPAPPVEPDTLAKVHPLVSPAAPGEPPAPSPRKIAPAAPKEAKSPSTRPTAQGTRSIVAETGARRVMLPTGIALLLLPGADLEVSPADADRITVSLKRGSLLASVDPDRHGPPFSVVTPLGAVTVKGTVFSVTALAAAEQRALDGNFQRLVSDDNVGVDTVDLRALEPPPPSVRELLLRVRRYKTQKKWRLAASAYRDIIRHHPTSGSAKDALVALGDLQLNRLNRPDLALKRFNQYIDSRQKTLDEEALVGKSRALRALGRLIEEQHVLEAFIGRYPGSLHGPAVRSRLANLKKLQNRGAPN